MRNLHHMSVCVDGAGVSHAKCRRVSPVAGMSSSIVRPIASGSQENFHLSPVFAPTHAMYVCLFMRSPASPETRTATTRKPPKVSSTVDRARQPAVSLFGFA
jgi:hypothetical protein